MKNKIKNKKPITKKTQNKLLLSHKRELRTDFTDNKRQYRQKKTMSGFIQQIWQLRWNGWIPEKTQFLKMNTRWNKKL